MTFNLADFPASRLAPLGVQAVHPDDYLLQQVVDHGGLVARFIREIAAARRDPPETARDVIAALGRSGLPRSAAALRAS